MAGGKREDGHGAVGAAILATRQPQIPSNQPSSTSTCSITLFGIELWDQDIAMTESLYLIETRAAKDYTCPACNGVIHRGDSHFRHDPPPYASWARGLRRSHWCFACVTSLNVPKNPVTARIRVPADHFARLHVPLVRLVSAGALIAKAIAADPSVLHTIAPEELEELVCDRLFEWGFEPKRCGHLNRKDGGLDILFWPRDAGAFPVLGGVQVKSARHKKVAPAAVREFESVIGLHSLNVGLLVTNTGFTPDAKWYAEKKANLLRLRDFNDLVRWARAEFESPDEWREFPEALTLCPGVKVDLR